MQEQHLHGGKRVGLDGAVQGGSDFGIRVVDESTFVLEKNVNADVMPLVGGNHQRSMTVLRQSVRVKFLLSKQIVDKRRIAVAARCMQAAVATRAELLEINLYR